MLVSVGALLGGYNHLEIDKMRLTGDVESNPGPYEITKSVQSIFDVSNAAVFAETAGK